MAAGCSIGSGSAGRERVGGRRSGVAAISGMSSSGADSSGMNSVMRMRSDVAKEISGRDAATTSTVGLVLACVTGIGGHDGCDGFGYCGVEDGDKGGDSGGRWKTE